MMNRRRPLLQMHTAIIVAALAAIGAVQPAAAQTAIPPSPKDFAMAAAQSDQYEIQAGRVAVTQSHNPRIRAFAQAMIDEHSRTSAELTKAVAASGLLPPPQAIGSDQAPLLATLQSLRGADFDRTYIKQQVLAHQEALAVEGSFAEAGADPNLKAAARTTVPVIQHHLGMAQQIEATLRGS
jgi:putative membrane protein